VYVEDSNVGAAVPHRWRTSCPSTKNDSLSATALASPRPGAKRGCCPKRYRTP
jgi:hypothetical protein